MKKVFVFTLFFTVVGGFFVWNIFLENTKEVVSESKEQIAEIGNPDFQEEVEDVSDEEPEEESPPVQSKQVKDYCSDPEGQLVHCLFEVSGVPSPKGVGVTAVI